MSVELLWNYTERGKKNYSDSDLSQWHFVLHKSHRFWYRNYTLRTWGTARPILKVTTDVRCVLCVLRWHLL